jgi:hypothetical protein
MGLIVLGDVRTVIGPDLRLASSVFFVSNNHTVISGRLHFKNLLTGP